MTTVIRPPLRWMRVGQHLIAAVLTVLGAVRALGDGAAPVLVIAAAAALLAWYAAGILVARRGAENSAERPSTRAERLWLAGLAVVWVAACAVSPEFIWLAFLLWLLAGALLPALGSVIFSLAVFVVVVSAPLVHHATTSYANILGPLIGGLFALGISRGYRELLRDAAERERLVTSLTAAHQELADVQDELALTQRHSGELAERTRLSRDIHDTVAQGLSSIRLLGVAAAQRAPETERRALEQIAELAGTSLVDVRRIVAALAPAELDEQPLAGALGRLLERLAAETGMSTRLAVDATVPALPAAVDVALLRTAQSALANVRRHAVAQSVVVSLIDAGDTVRLDIVDDGRGFDVDAWARHAPDGASYGLRFMRSRLRELGGGLDVEGAPGEGTAVSAYLPVHPANPVSPTEESS